MNKLNKKEKLKYIKKISRLESELSKYKKALKNNARLRSRKTHF